MKSLFTFVSLLSILPFGFSQHKPVNNNPNQPSVGRFKISINDPRLPLQEAATNQSHLLPNLDSLFYKVFKFYDSYDDAQIPSVENQTQNLTSLAQASLNKGLSQEDFEKYSQVLLNASTDEAKQPYNIDGLPNPDVVGFYLDAIYNMTYQTFYYVHGAYIGVGRDSQCADQINQVLADKDEWAKMGSGIATTLMALLPTFLAFGHLFVPRSSEAYTTSALVGLTTSFFTFGLPITSISAVKQSNVHTLSVFGIAALALIAKLGETSKKDGTAEFIEDPEKLKTWTREHNGDEVKARFVAIKTLVNAWERRWHLWHAPALFVAGAQIVIFTLAVYPLFRYLGVPQSIFGCGNSFDWTGAYLGISAGVNTLIRYIMWEMSDHERVKVYALSKPAKKRLQSIIDATPEGETTSTHLPPLHPPYVLFLRRCLYRILHPRSSMSTSERPHGPMTLIQRATRLVRRRVAFIFKGRNFLEVIRAGFIGHTVSARRWRPVYLLVHLSKDGRNPLITLFTGFIEAALLLVLTLFFAAQWGGNLVLTMIALALLLVFITLGRALGLIYVWLSSQVWGLSVINCDSVDEIRGVLRIVCSMEEVLVYVNGATYYGGYRMDGREQFEEFIDEYERGNFDKEEDDDNLGKPEFVAVQSSKMV